MPPTVLSLGSINADVQFRVSEPIEEGSTFLADGTSRLSGGKAANRAVLARRLGVSARLVGQVDGDDLAEQTLRPPQVAGLDLSGVGRAASGIAFMEARDLPLEDATHVGDALAIALPERQAIREAATFAMICSSFAVRARGSRDAFPHARRHLIPHTFGDP